MLNKQFLVFLLSGCAFITSAWAQCVTTISYIRDVKVMEDEYKVRFIGERLNDDYYVADFDLDNGELIYSGIVGAANYQKPYSNPAKNDITITDDGTYEKTVTVTITEAGKTVLKESFQSYGMYCSWDFNNHRGILLRYMPHSKGDEEIYIIKTGSKRSRIKKTKGSAYKNFVFSKDGKYAVSPRGILIDMEKEKVISAKFGDGWGNEKSVRFDSTGTSVALPANDLGMVVKSIPDGNIIAAYPLPASINRELVNNIIPSLDMKGYIVYFEKTGSTSWQNAWFIKDGNATLLCDPNTPSQEEAYRAFVDAKFNQQKYVDVNKFSAENVYKAEERLLNYIKLTDDQFAPYADKILRSGNDAWILYRTKARAHDILNSQKNAIADFLKIYGSYIKAKFKQELEDRIRTIDATNAKIPY